ncbi:heat-shock protein Hsp20 [Streptomyces sp. AS58]|uniref:Hsp20/alpha crystallin family protein n=1 Tax=Streptomyces sp. AS58 TaxID=1519489 RepID=UPI0006AF2ED4|nr:Hsp20/alpha crystallin family protein [Streptomyces sp. AS58]KOV49923.1 heat-shock protein Hsp20 [Streptomyces sp. AS58]
MTHPVRRGRSGLPSALSELEDLRSRVDQLMHTAFPGGSLLQFGGAEPWAPLADVEDAEDAYLVELELPGVDKDRITVEVAEGELDVHGEVQEKEHTGTVRRQTRHVGQFDYRMTLPPNADTEHISADLTNGVLTVRVPKTEKGKARRIEIGG